MRWLIHFIARLYPRFWRARYGAEYAALLEEIKPSAGAALNILTGAIAMQMRTWSRWRILAASAAFSVMVSVAVYLASPKLYHGVVALNFPGRVDAPEGSDTVYQLGRTDLANIIATEHLYERERTRRPFDDVIDEMRKRVAIETNGPSFSIAFDDTNPHVAQKVVLDISALFFQEWGAAHNVRISNVRPDPAWVAPPLHYRREAGRGPIMAGLSSFFLMLGVLDFWQRRTACEDAPS
jgi:hypothetical protein